MKKVKLSPLNVNRLRHAEFGQLIVRFFEDFANANLNAETDSDFKTVFDALKSNITTFNAALDQVSASEETKKIADADKERDADFQALKTAIKPYRNAKAEEDKTAYQSLTILFSEYKGVEATNYEEETNRLNNLLTRLNAEPYKAHIATLGITKFVGYLSESNKAFNDIFAQRSHHTSQKIVYDVKTLRKTLADDYRKLTTYIASLAEMKQNAFYKDTLNIINNGRKYFDDIILARRK